MSKRYIDADALIKDLERRRLVFKNTIRVADALRTQGRVMREAIEEAPTADVVEVVRCADCVHYLDGKCYVKNHYPLFKYDVNIHSRKKDDYCSYGERRAGEDEQL